jgi:hypothetical protein
VTDLLRNGHLPGEDVQNAEPPRIVLEQPAPCAESGAEEIFARPLAAARGPRPGWSVRVRIVHEGAGLRARGELRDEADAVVAERTFTSGARTCAPLAKALGVWATITLDDELVKARDAAKAAEAAKSDPSPSDGGSAGNAGAGSETRWASRSSMAWPPPAPPLVPDPDRPMNTRPKRTFEVGVSSLLMGGTGTGALVGPAFFGNVELVSGFLLRPTLAFASTVQEQRSGFWGIARLDGCGRIPGNYKESRGIQLDVCAGSEVGFLHAMYGTFPTFALGPSASMRGDLSSNLAAEIRGVGLVNVVQSHLDEVARVPFFAGRAEVGITWRIQ